MSSCTLWVGMPLSRRNAVPEASCEGRKLREKRDCSLNDKKRFHIGQATAIRTTFPSTAPASRYQWEIVVGSCCRRRGPRYGNLAGFRRAIRSPSAAQRFIELDDRHQLNPTGFRQFELGLKQTTLRRQHVQIAGPPSLISLIGEMQGRLQRRHLLLLGVPLLTSFLHGNEGIFDFPECVHDGLLILERRLLGPRFIHRHLVTQRRRVQQGTNQRRADVLNKKRTDR